MTRIRAAVLLLAFLSSVAAEAQLPRGKAKYPNSMSTRQIAQYLQSAKFWHLVTVDSGGAGDYTDLGDALAYVAAQTPSASNRYTVLVYPGSVDSQQYAYSEESLTLPAFTTIQGVVGPELHSVVPAGVPAVKLTSTTGGVTFGNQSGVVNMGFRTDASVSAGYKMFSFPGGVSGATMRNVYAFVSSSVPDVQMDVFSFSGGSASFDDVSVQRSGTATVTRHIAAASGGLSYYGGRLIPGTSQAAVVETTGGTIRMFGGRIDAGATADLKNTSGTLSADHVAYSTESGVITRAGVLSPRVTSGTTPPATCVTPEIFVDTDGALCACTASNTWRCATVTTP